MPTPDQVKQIGNVLNNSGRPLKERFRALFTLKNIGGSLAIDEICNAFKDSSSLLKHELAYCLGQMQDTYAIETLKTVLRDENQEPIVRHEAAEALGAIGEQEVLDVLELYKNDPVTEIAETCTIAIELVKWKLKGNCVENPNPYSSVDPSPPLDESISIEKISEFYLDQRKSLFDRYRAMFSLRNIGTVETILIIAKGLKDSSTLFRHEVAFVLGQIQKECSIPSLRESLENKEEHEMVRHECAEALGAIGTEECFDILNKYLADEKRVVRESCEIALDMCEYENSKEFQYADGLFKLIA